MIVSAPPPPVRPALSPAARALRMQRVFARLQEGASYQDIAAEKDLSRERLRQTDCAQRPRAGKRAPPDHKRMQFARLEPALSLVARGVADGDVKAIPLLLSSGSARPFCDPADLRQLATTLLRLGACGKAPPAPWRRAADGRRRRR